MRALIELTDIIRHYRSGDTVVRALDGVTLRIDRGEFVAIMGQSGSGKSTLMNILGCLDRPSGGTYTIDGRDALGLGPDELAALRGHTFGFVFQRYNLLSTSTAEENVALPALYAGMAKTNRRTKAREILSGLGLGDRTDHRPNQLSGGQQQRVAIARALMNTPPVILADEPTGALDSSSGHDVMEILKDLHRRGHTIILVTHDEAVAANAHRIIRISDGKILSDLPNTPESGDARAVTLPHEAIHTPPGRAELERMAHPGAAGMTATAGETAMTALRSLRANLFRTLLTLLGIVIGVAAVVTMMAVGNGSKQDVMTRISAMGTNILSVRPGAPGIRSSGSIATMNVADAEAIESLPNVVAVVPERSGNKTVRFGSTDYATTVEGVGASMPVARDWPVAKGQFFALPDLESYAPVAVLGNTVANILFKDDPDGAVGQYILIGNIPFEVIGIMSEKGAAPWGRDQDDAVFVPVTTGLVRLFGRPFLSGITIKVADTQAIDATEQAIRTLLIDRHKTEDFQVRNTASFLEMAAETQNTLTILLGAVAAISLLVGGIGVMNIMLVSVTERTREIGVRMAIGARRRDILFQFNTEAAIVCTIGGALGLLIGFGAGSLLSAFEVKIMFSAAPAITAFVCAVATGLAFGYLPARKASRLDPVVALSTE